MFYKLGGKPPRFHSESANQQKWEEITRQRTRFLIPSCRFGRLPRRAIEMHYAAVTHRTVFESSRHQQPTPFSGCIFLSDAIRSLSNPGISEIHRHV
jgi:hypothetical protein